MSEISVRPLGEEDWAEYRRVRLDALQESPEAFVANYDDEQGYDEEFWRARMRRSRRLLAEVDGTPTGVVSVGRSRKNEEVGELFGLWVRPEARGTGVAWRLVEAGASQARDDDRTHLVYWVGTDNGRGVAFASSFGFRPTDRRRPMRVGGSEDGEEEMAMVLPLGSDPGSVPSSLMH
ncbi:MAG TPA: GNAT family N-acetyltransferase [Segeticoccus sp.]|jgi:ribosomal protein S18 acetylase RimI-like enzyme|nr:GNAT family N-acetyltransferase [Segeticoccus sp.]